MAYHIHERLGVVGQIIPWNLPILMAASLEGNTGKAFHTRSRLFTDEEWVQIEAQVARDLA